MKPDMSKVADKQSYAKVLALLDVESGLSDWEVAFAESIVEQLEDGQLLTAKQQNKLDDILERVDSSPDGCADTDCR